MGVARVSRRLTPLLIGVTLDVHNREGVREGENPSGQRAGRTDRSARLWRYNIGHNRWL